MSIDPLADFDWAAHWRELVERREAEAPIDPSSDFWAGVAQHLRYDPADAAGDPLLKAMEPYLSPGRTAIDAGAGAGRHAVPLADRLDWVTAVEPSEGMRAAIPHRDNLTVVAGTWQEADVAPADLVVCAHVLYFIPEPVPFIEKLTAAARVRVFALMRDRPFIAPSEPLYEVLTGRPRTRMPHASDLWNLLRWMGISADFQYVEYGTEQVYPDVEAAVEECRARLTSVWREEPGREWLEQNLEPREGGGVAYGGEMVAGVVHWHP